MNNTPILTLPYKDHLKYLGCYFSGFNSTLSTSRQLLKKISQVKKAILATSWNGHISKQVTQWIIPSYLEYALYISLPNQTSLNLIQKTINSICKSKYRLERTTPNCFINSPIGLNIINIEHKTQVTLAKLLATKLSNQKTSFITRKEILSIQTHHNIWKCPLHNPQFFKKSWIISAATILKQFNISICQDPCIFERPNSNFSLGLLTSLNKKQALQTYAHNLSFLHDLLQYQSPNILQWHQLKTRTTISLCGPTSSWFMSITNPNLIHGSTYPRPNLKAKFWAYIDNHKLFIIRESKNKSSSTDIIGHHYTRFNEIIHECNCHSPNQLIHIQRNLALSLWTAKRSNHITILNPINKDGSLKGGART
jgi:hypothetical protein